MKFDEFWEQWPVKEKKKTSKAIWKRKKLDKKADEIIANVIWRKANCYKWTRGFIHNATTYLNQELWEDERITVDEARQRGIIFDKPTTSGEIFEQGTRDAFKRSY